MNIAAFNDFVSIPVPPDLYQAVARRYPDRIGSVFENVVWDFLDRTEGDFIAARDAVGGITWGKVNLPDGTELRVRYKGSYDYASIEGDKIMWHGKEISSPSQLARRMCGNTSVNAWISIEVKRPGDAGWTLADHLRKGR